MYSPRYTHCKSCYFSRVCTLKWKNAKLDTHKRCVQDGDSIFFRLFLEFIDSLFLLESKEMAHSDNNALSSAFKTFFERETLTGPNFNEWHRSLRIVLRVADTYEYFGIGNCPDHPLETATAEEKAALGKLEYK
ncbi:hypothetical protein Tco_0366478 [Tanacetum coccineum]